MKSLIKYAIPVMALVALFACGKDDDNDPTGPNNNTFKIVAAVNGVDTTMSGSVTFTVTNDSAVTGVFHIVEPTEADHNLTGFFVDITNVILASGGGFDFSGALNDTTGLFHGVVTGAANCLVTGALDEDNDNSAVAFCGTFTGDDFGTWNFLIEGSSLIGSHSNHSGDSEILTGTISGNIITLYEDGIECGAGIRDGDNVSGTWHSASGDESGTWSGSRCN